MLLKYENVINKDIIYNDQVLSQKEIGTNLELTTIYNIDKKSLEKCIEIIVNSNLDVIFDTIYYSESDEKVQFYTNKKITRTNWYNEIKKENQSAHNSSNIEALKEAKNIFSRPVCKDSECISIYDLAEKIINAQKSYQKHKNNFMKKLTPHRNNYLSFNLEKKELFIKENDKETIISKKDGKIYIKNTEKLMIENWFKKHQKAICNIYDTCIMYEIFFKSITEENVEIKSVNSNFKVNFYEKGISIKIDNDDEDFNFELKCGASYYDSSKEYHYQKCSDELERTFKSEEDELFKRIFVRIDECPEFLRIALRIDREEQLRKEKCLKLRKKIFPFF